MIDAGNVPIRRNLSESPKHWGMLEGPTLLRLLCCGRIRLKVASDRLPDKSSFHPKINDHSIYALISRDCGRLLSPHFVLFQHSLAVTEQGIVRSGQRSSDLQREPRHRVLIPENRWLS